MTKIRASKTGKSLLILQDNVMYQPSLMGFFTSVSKQTKHPPFHLFTAVVIYDRKSSRKKNFVLPTKKNYLLFNTSCPFMLSYYSSYNSEYIQLHDEYFFE